MTEPSASSITDEVLRCMSRLTLTAGALNVAANTLTINDGSSVVGGSLTSGATGTVNVRISLGAG